MQLSKFEKKKGDYELIEAEAVTYKTSLIQLSIIG